MNNLTMLALDLIVVGIACLGAVLLLRISAWRDDALRSLSQPRPRVNPDSWPRPPTPTTAPLATSGHLGDNIRASARNIWRSPLD